MAPEMCPLCWQAEKKERPLVDGGPETLHQIAGPIPARVMECTESDYDSSDRFTSQNRSHYRRIMPDRAPPTAELPRTSNGWHSSQSGEPDGLPR
jgi:hypothetical protein